MSNHLLEHALNYAEKAGWRIFPCKLDKSPYTKHGCKDATIDPEQIKKWWNQWPDASIGCACGPESGIWVLDVDLPTGPESLEKLIQVNGALPETRLQKTGSGGFQYFFSWNGRVIKNSSSKIGQKLDTRGSGGYIILPPSNHPSGGRYEWIKRIVNIPHAPDWLSEMAAKDVDNINYPLREGQSRYGEKALADEIIKLSGSGEGQRNNQLNESAFCLGQLVAGGELEHGQVYHSLYGLAISVGLNPVEAKKTIESGMKSGMQSPRTAPNSGKDNFCNIPDYVSNVSNVSSCQQLSADVSKNDQNVSEHDLFVSSCQQTPPDESINPPDNIMAAIEQFILNSSGSFTTKDIDREFNLSTRLQKNARSRALNYMASKKKLINKDKGVAGKYHILDSKIEWVDLDAPVEESFPVILPFNLHNHIIIPPKSIILLAGSTNAGKTAFMLNLLKLNRDQKYKTMYLMSEMGSGEYLSRLKCFGEPIAKWKKINAASRSYDFNGAIEHHNKNGLTCIDYLEEIQGEYFKIASNIRDIYDAIGDGVAVIAIQKRSDQRVARGGEGTMEKSRLYMTLDHLCTREHSIVCALTITKLKAFKDKNIQNHELHFEVSRGAHIQTLMDWTPCHKVDRDRCRIAYENESSRMRDTSNDSLEPVYFHQKDNKKSFRVTENTVVQWGAQFKNIDDIYEELQKLSRQHNKKPFVNHFTHLCNIMADIDKRKGEQQ